MYLQERENEEEQELDVDDAVTSKGPERQRVDRWDWQSGIGL